MLLERGAAINHTDEQGYSALLHACDGDYASTVKLLIANGADVERGDADGRSALLWACMRGHVNTVQVYLLHVHVILLGTSSVCACDVALLHGLYHVMYCMGSTA